MTKSSNTETFGRYQLHRRIATGGMAEIFLASTVSVEGFQKQLIIKRMLPKWSQDRSFVDKFIDEAKISSKLHHANIVQVFDFGLQEEHYYLALEYVHGADLSQIIKLHKQLQQYMPIHLALFIVEQVCIGLDFAHEYRDPGAPALNIVHRDISPSNILLSLSGQVKVGDFGIAHASERSSQTEPGAILGKISYMSPEQACGEKLDRRSDIYSIGLVLYELLSNLRIVQHIAKKDLIRFAQTPVIPSIRQFREEIDEDLAHILDRAIAVDLDRRFSTCFDFAEALQRYRVQKKVFETHLSLARYLEHLFAQGVPERKGADNKNISPVAQPIHKEEAAREQAKVEAKEALQKTGLLAHDPFQRSIKEHLKKLVGKPDIWIIFELAELAKKYHHAELAYRLYRLTSIKFVQQGMLLQSVRSFRGMLEITKTRKQAEQDIRLVLEQKGKPNHLLNMDTIVGDPTLDSVLQPLFFQPQDPSPSLLMVESALLQSIPFEEWINLIELMEYQQVRAGSFLLKTDEQIASLYFVIKGRIIVSSLQADGKKIGLDSLTYGDALGEGCVFNAISPVDAIAFDDVEYLEIKKEKLLAVKSNLTHFFEQLSELHAQHSAESLLIRSSFFCSLSSVERKKLLLGSTFKRFKPKEVLITEGSATDAIYIIQEGSAEAVSTVSEHRWILQVLDSFGEITAVLRIPRTHTVYAGDMGVEVLVLQGSGLWKILRKNKELEEKLGKVIQKRHKEEGWPS